MPKLDENWGKGRRFPYYGGGEKKLDPSFSSFYSDIEVLKDDLSKEAAAGDEASR